MKISPSLSLSGAVALAFFAALSSQTPTANAAPEGKSVKESPDLTGPMTRTELEARKQKWLTDGLKAEKSRLQNAADQSLKLKALAQKLEATDVEIYFASWCSDTHDHLPVFLATVDASQAKPRSMQFFGLDKRRTYPGFKNERKIDRIPTFVFVKDGKEVGRFVESPKVSVLEDVVGLIP